jgi:hypothetical protein
MCFYASMFYYLFFSLTVLVLTTSELPLNKDPMQFVQLCSTLRDLKSVLEWYQVTKLLSLRVNLLRLQLITISLETVKRLHALTRLFLLQYKSEMMFSSLMVLSHVALLKSLR